MTAPELIFEEPPPPKSGRPGSGIREWLDSLRQHPGQWAKFPTEVNGGIGGHVTAGSAYGVTAGEFEVTMRRAPEAGKYRAWLYARYIGGES